MDTQLTHAARIQLARSLRRRYQAASSRAKKQILYEFIAVSGYHPKYAVHLLNAADGASAPRGGRVRSIVLWEASDRICGKRLKPLLRIPVPALERHGHLKLDEVIRGKVLAMSAATIDRRTAYGAQRDTHEEAPSRDAGDPPPHRGANFCRLERAASRQHGNGSGRALWRHESWQLRA